MSRRIFGLDISPLTAAEIARKVVEEAPPGGAMGLIVTPNIQNIALIYENEASRAAYSRAAIITCDGFPVHYYAKLRGAPSPERVTGCDMVEFIMHRDSFPAHHRFFFVVATEDLAQAVRKWAIERGLDGRVATAVPDFGFERDAQKSAALVQAIRAHGTTVLFLGLGSPKSEVFADKYRAELPPCWTLCIGQAVKMALGLTPAPPGLVKALNLEWAWRMIWEPRRLAPRYISSSVLFVAAVAKDLRARS
jgi:N-acetylglucosaminyldiphosphoundecaprenol N-acetyl-beta-D-mannosaminyltransferase